VARHVEEQWEEAAAAAVEGLREVEAMVERLREAPREVEATVGRIREEEAGAAGWRR
jgi:hypothetical protein